MADSGSGSRPREGIDGPIERIEGRLDELRRMQFMGRMVEIVLILVVLIEFAIFAVTTKAEVSNNFNEQEVQKAFAKGLPVVMPKIRDQVRTVLQNVEPVYRQEASRRLQASGPLIAKDAMARFESLPEDTGNEMMRKLQVAFQTAIDSVEPDIKKTYPSLSNERKMKILQDEFHFQIQKQNDALAKKVTAISEHEKASMLNALDKFGVTAPTKVKISSRDREREFLHTLVDVLMDTDLEADLSIPTAEPPATQPEPHASVVLALPTTRP